MTDINRILGEIHAKISGMTPEEAAQFRDSLPETTKKQLQTYIRGQLVNQLPIGYDGARHYYFCKYGWEVPEHAKAWVLAIIEAYLDETGVLLEGFRGSTKSTVTTTVCEYLLGKNPHKSGLITAATETDANAVGKFMSDTIDLNVGWKVCFPTVVPDKERGWGADSGYFIKDTSVEYGKWVQMTMKDHQRDPSLLAVSISSAVGKHPSLFLLCDDIHTGKNSQGAELKTVKSRFFSDVFPTMNRPKVEGEQRPFFVSTFTPWDEEDTNAELKRSGVYKHLKTPILEFTPDGEYVFEGERCKLAWASAYDIEKIKQLRRTNSAVEFARMYLCDLKRAGQMLFRYYSYPREQINPTWLRAAGVDYASIQNPTRQVVGGRSHFAICLGTKTPQNQIVVVDGIVEQCTQADGENYVLSFQEKSVNFRHTALEAIGKGEEFYNTMRRNPKARVVPRTVRGKKSDRLYKELSPLLESGILLVSDADTMFLNTFRRFMDKFPNIDTHDKEWDVADSVYHMVSCFPECLAIPAQPTQNLSVERTKRSSPWNSVGG